MTIWILTKSILVLRETVLSNLHTFQLAQSNQFHFFHIHETLITNHNPLQSLESSQIQHSERSVIQTSARNSELGNPRTKRIPLSESRHNSIHVRLLDEIRVIRQCANIY